MKTPSFIALGKAVLFALPLALEVSGSDLMAVTLVPLALALRLSESKTRTAAEESHIVIVVVVVVVVIYVDSLEALGRGGCIAGGRFLRRGQ